MEADRRDQEIEFLRKLVMSQDDTIKKLIAERADLAAIAAQPRSVIPAVILYPVAVPVPSRGPQPYIPPYEPVIPPMYPYEPMQPHWEYGTVYPSTICSSLMQ